MTLMTTSLTSLTMLATGAPPESGGHGPGEAVAAAVTHSAGEPILFFIVMLGVMTIFIGLCLSLYRLLRGPHLADRVLAGDVFAFHVVALVILLTIQLRTTQICFSAEKGYSPPPMLLVWGTWVLVIQMRLFSQVWPLPSMPSCSSDQVMLILMSDPV